MTDPKHIEWCKNLMGMLAEGGAWAVPRSALLFKRRGNALVLVGRMPHHEALPMSKAEWEKHQEEDFECMKKFFEESGFEVPDELNLPGVTKASGSGAGSTE